MVARAVAPQGWWSVSGVPWERRSGEVPAITATPACTVADRRPGRSLVRVSKRGGGRHPLLPCRLSDRTIPQVLRVVERDGRAGEWLRVEIRPSSLSARRRARSNLLHLLDQLFTGPHWITRRADVVLVDVPTGRIVKTWHEGGKATVDGIDDVVILQSVLEEELAEMSYGEFVEKWDVPSAP